MSRVNVETYVKKVQRRVNALIKRQNKALEDDELWLGRFYIQQLKRDEFPLAVPVDQLKERSESESSSPAVRRPSP